MLLPKVSRLLLIHHYTNKQKPYLGVCNAESVLSIIKKDVFLFAAIYSKLILFSNNVFYSHYVLI